MTIQPTRRWLTRAEAAEHARRSPATIDRWSRAARLKSATGLIDVELLDAYISDGRPGVLRVRRARKQAA